MFDVNKIARQNVLALKPYQSARDEFKGNANISLDANENPFGFDLNRYPDSSLKDLKNAYADFRKTDADRLIFGNGSDEIIDLLIRAFCQPGKDQILVFKPTFGMYQVCASVNDVAVIEQELDSDFQIDLNQAQPLLSDKNLKLIFICSPNNPTGNVIDKGDILTLCNGFEGIVVLDEAYADFSGQSLVNEAPTNLFILQTFSKALGLAGARLGVGIGDPSIIVVLNKIKPPYNINALTQKKAIESLQRPEEISKNIQILNEERTKLSAALAGLEDVRKVFPSEGNFLLVQFADSSNIYKNLVEKGIVVRDRSSQVPNSLRITVGTPEENEQLLAALKGTGFEYTGRIGECIRKTSETEIQIKVNLDDPSGSTVNTGIPFFDHMLDQLARHGGIGLNVHVKGDLKIDLHHTIEDTALALGAAFDQALGSKSGIERYGFLLPMDDCLAQVAVDFGGRPWLVWDAQFNATHVGEMPTEMAEHFFKSFSDTARCNLNIKAEGTNDHHKIESIFKAFSRAIKMAIREDESGILPSTKGVL